MAFSKFVLIYAYLESLLNHFKAYILNNYVKHATVQLPFYFILYCIVLTEFQSSSVF